MNSGICAGSQQSLIVSIMHVTNCQSTTDMNSLATRNGTAHGIEVEKTGVSSGKIKDN